jgi:hypothetical protein
MIWFFVAGCWVLVARYWLLYVIKLSGKHAVPKGLVKIAHQFIGGNEI